MTDRTLPRARPERRRTSSRVPWDDPNLLRACEHSRQARQTFVHRFGADIERWVNRAVRRCGMWLDRAELEDLRQEVFARLFADDCRRLSSFSGRNGCPVRGWLRVVTTRLTYNQLRRRPMATDEDAVARAPDTSPDALDHLVDRERRALLAGAVEALPPAEQRLWQLYMDEGLSAPRIADRLEISVGAVYTRKCRLVARLRTMVEAAA